MPCLLGACLALALASEAGADRLVPRRGKPLQGKVVRETDDEIVFNPCFSTQPEMVWEVVRLPRDRVKRLEIEPRPEVEFRRRLAAAADDVSALAEVARYAGTHRQLKAEARMAWALVLAASPDDVEALKGIGGHARWNTERRGNPALDADLAARLRTYAETEDPEARRTQAAELKRLGFPWRAEALERMRRSTSAFRGYDPARPLSWGADRLPGATYAFFVPDAYDPTRPWPLLIGLHGGGPDGKAHDEVVGSGRSAMMFYRDLAARRGYLVACPDALMAGWPNPLNEDLVRAVLEEVKHLYNVDLDRVYLTGHSMGGFGTWALGPRMADDLAAIAPMSGGGRGDLGPLIDTRTPLYIYHSDNDYVSVESDRAAARRLMGTEHDWIYTELPGRGHAFPDVIRVELFDFLDLRRRYVPRRKHAWPRTSFAGKASKAELHYLGDPLAEFEGEVEDLDDWVDQIRLGGGRAEQAVTRVGEARPEGATAALSKVLGDRRVSFAARAAAATGLGRLGDPAGAKALRRALLADAARDQAIVAIRCAEALEALGDAEGGIALGRAVTAWTTWLEEKRSGDRMAFSDWRRGAGVLVALVGAWAALPGDGDIDRLDAQVVRRVLGADWQVDTSERVPQDPSVPRAALAGAAARACAAWDAEEAVIGRLKEAVAGDARAVAAVVTALRDSK